MKTVIYKLHSSWKWNFYHRQKCKNGKLLQMDLKVHINICCTLPHTHTHHVTHLEDSSRSPRSRLSPFTSSRVTVRLSGLRGSGSSWPSGFANSSTKLSRKLWAPSCSFIPTAILWVWSNWWQVRLSHTGHFCNLPCSCSHLKRKRKKKKNSTTHKHSPHFPHSLTAVSLQCFVWTGLILRVPCFDEHTRPLECRQSWSVWVRAVWYRDNAIMNASHAYSDCTNALQYLATYTCII